MDIGVRRGIALFKLMYCRGVVRCACMMLLIVGLSCVNGANTAAQTVTILADDLDNPRGVAVLADGRLLVVEAGQGRNQPGEQRGTGKISIFDDVNGDGDYDDAGERIPFVRGVPSYNSLNTLGTGHDEVYGLSDIVVLSDGSIYYTKDNPFFEEAVNRGIEGAFYGDTGIFVVSPDFLDNEMFVKRAATLNSLAYHPQQDLFYVVESGFNRLMSVDHNGETNVVADMPILAHGQQPVPAGVAVDPRTGDVLVALFSGYVHDYHDGDSLSFMVGDAKIMRYNPDTGDLSEAVTHLTTAVDVAVDEQGNIYVAEMTRTWATAWMPADFALYDDAAPPDPGGYVRDSGRVTMFPADGRDPIILLDAIDTPAALTYADGHLYVSAGVGTPQRNVITPTGAVRPIRGRLLVIDDLPIQE